MEHKTNSLGSRRSRVKEMLIAILFDMPTGLSGLIDGLSRLVKLLALPVELASEIRSGRPNGCQRTRLTSALIEIDWPSICAIR